MSTDTAFALGVLALVAPGGTRLRVRLLTLAIVDDLVALLVIATVYTEDVSFVPLAIAVGLFGVLFALRYAPIAWRGQAAAVARRGDLGRAVRVGYRPGHHRARGRPRHERVSPGAHRPRAGDGARRAPSASSPRPSSPARRSVSVASAISANERLQYRLHPWTSFVIVPLFALANVGHPLGRAAARRRRHVADHARNRVRLRGRASRSASSARRGSRRGSAGCGGR